MKKNNAKLNTEQFGSTKGQKKQFNPVVKYDNADVEKVNIFAENRGKAGVYRWINKISGNTYVGSSIDLGNRLYTYYSLRSLAKSNRPIMGLYLLGSLLYFNMWIVQDKCKSSDPNLERKVMSSCSWCKLEVYINR
jgi:hypothetical protein